MLRVLGVTILLRLCLSFLVTWRHIRSILHHGSLAARCSGPPGAQHADDLVGIAVLLGEIPLLVAHLEEGLDEKEWYAGIALRMDSAKTSYTPSF